MTVIQLTSFLSEVGPGTQLDLRLAITCGLMPDIILQVKRILSHNVSHISITATYRPTSSHAKTGTGNKTKTRNHNDMQTHRTPATLRRSCYKQQQAK